jgi:hypothetical protein
MLRLGRTVVFAVAATIVFTTWARFLDARLVDDAYIFFRYAENIAGGAGPVYNLGERVEGFSSALWTFLLAGVRLVTDNLESAVLTLGVAIAVALAVLVHRSAQSDERDRSDEAIGWILGLGTLALPAVVYWARSGMEEVFFALVTSAALLSALGDARAERVSARTGALIALAALTRPEGVLLGAWIAVSMTAAHGRVDRYWWRHITVPLTVRPSLWSPHLLPGLCISGAWFPTPTTPR